MNKILCLLLLSCLSVNLLGQQFLYIKKEHAPPVYRLTLNEVLQFKTADSDNFVEGRVTHISTEHLGLNEVLYSLEDIVVIRRYQQFTKAAGTGLGAAGLLYPVLASVNQVINFRRPLLTDGQAIASASMLGSGLILRWMSRKTYRKEDGYIWEVIDFQKLIDE